MIIFTFSSVPIRYLPETEGEKINESIEASLYIYTFNFFIYAALLGRGTDAVTLWLAIHA